MGAAQIAMIASALLQAAPEMFSLYQRAVSGDTVTADEVQAVLSQYGVDQAVLTADIEAKKAAGK